MILVAAILTYIRCMQSVAPNRNSPSLRLKIEDQQLQHRPIISIIDDDDSMRGALKGLVTSLGFKAYTFASAEQFLDSPRLNDTSCLITDLQMPGLTGIELQQSLLAQDRHIPIIFVTAFPEERMRARAMEAGALGFLGKPFDSSTLVELIDQAVESGRKA
jgi:FixJ family two-component response regulator